jgi:hypothetical protein
VGGWHPSLHMGGKGEAASLRGKHRPSAKEVPSLKAEAPNLSQISAAGRIGNKPRTGKLPTKQPERAKWGGREEHQVSLLRAGSRPSCQVASPAKDEMPCTLVLLIICEHLTGHRVLLFAISGDLHPGSSLPRCRRAHMAGGTQVRPKEEFLDTQYRSRVQTEGLWAPPPPAPANFH